MNTENITRYGKPFLFGAVIGVVVAGLISLFTYGSIKAIPVIITGVVFGIANAVIKK